MKSDSVSVINNLNEKDSLNLKCNQNLIIHYPFDVAQLAELDKKNILQEITRDEISKITITGYTDSIGGDGIYNKQLSFKRAKIISQYLLDGDLGFIGMTDLFCDKSSNSSISISIISSI